MSECTSKMAAKSMQLYHAIIWTKDETRPGQRVTVLATDVQDAKRRLEAEHGEGTVFNIRNEDDANRPR